jgi:hypothetical protein
MEGARGIGIRKAQGAEGIGIRKAQRVWDLMCTCVDSTCVESYMCRFETPAIGQRSRARHGRAVRCPPQRPTFKYMENPLI